MADLVNLNRFRKEKARSDKAAKASANRILFGRTKAEKREAEREADTAGRRLDGHRREDGPDNSKP